MIDIVMMTGQRWKTSAASCADMFILELIRKHNNGIHWNAEVVQNIKGDYYTLGRIVALSGERFKHSPAPAFRDLVFEYLQGQDRPDQ